MSGGGSSYYDSDGNYDGPGSETSGADNFGYDGDDDSGDGHDHSTDPNDTPTDPHSDSDCNDGG